MDVNSTPVVVVPMDEEMAKEPALTIGQIFADKVMVKTLVSALAGIVSLGFKVAVDDATVDNITTVVTLGSMVLAAFFAQWDARKRAQDQAAKTREAVYAPATVSAIVAADQPKDVEAVVIPPPA